MTIKHRIRLQAQVWAATNAGHVRHRNEDYYAVSAPDAEAGASAWAGDIDPAQGWVLVADGMGGHVAGEVASLLAVKCLSILMPKITGEDAVAFNLSATNDALHEAMSQQPGLAGMGTTIVGLRLMGQEAICFNVGDSRIFALDPTGLCQLSDDHAVAGYMLTQCLGGAAPGPLKPCVKRLEIQLGTRFLLCTDGVTDTVADGDIASLMTSDEPAVALVQAALAAGGVDNVTAVVVRVT